MSHCVYNINYHIVFCPKYRHEVIKDGVAKAIKDVVQGICATYGYDLIQVAPAEIVKRLKSITANRIFAAFPDMKKKHFWGSGLWSRGYYIGTGGNVAAETIRRYIETQKSLGKEVKEK
ncbi:IS200/IS605 family transposase [Thermanaeromonas toyohensis]|uniref:IS200/IS605 family transposase n=1 Tax=Thermanaeromonas toyohensis TaxID=161154 RepID=UPI000A0691EA|nr:IS200/IS605 family transposase [Thermanaeromonas toyohensis]